MTKTMQEKKSQSKCLINAAVKPYQLQKGG